MSFSGDVSIGRNLRRRMESIPCSASNVCQEMVEEDAKEVCRRRWDRKCNMETASPGFITKVFNEARYVHIGGGEYSAGEQRP